MDGNGFKPEETSVSTHIVESCVALNVGTDGFNREVERCYERLNDRAKKDRSVIINVVQTINTPAFDSKLLFAYVVLTAQRISLADLERQQRAAQLRQGIR